MSFRPMSDNPILSTLFTTKFKRTTTHRGMQKGMAMKKSQCVWLMSMTLFLCGVGGTVVGQDDNGELRQERQQSESIHAPELGGDRSAQAGDSHVPCRRFALLVGVQHYPHLPAWQQLNGCRNDVEAIQRVLETRFGFLSENIVALLDEEATSERIRAAMRAIVEKTQELPEDGPHAQIVYYYAGHGSQIPDQEEGDPHCDEDDGLDETQVPYDATSQGGPEDIRDDEMYEFAQQICENGRAHLWMILDCCHSGSGARGMTRTRSVNRRFENALPPSGRSRVVLPKRLPDGAVQLSACRAKEKADEYEEGGITYGLLTRFLVEQLERQESISRLNYAMLRTRKQITSGNQAVA